MNKKLIISGVAAVTLIVAVTAFWLSRNTEVTLKTSSGQQVTVPTRPAEYNGVVTRIIGNEVTMNNVVTTLSAEEQAAKKAARQAMSQEERQALRQQELANTQTVEVSVVIPVGTPVFKSSGTGDPNASLVEASLSDIAEGINLSIWKNGTSIEFVKIKGTQE